MTDRRSRITLLLAFAVGFVETSVAMGAGPAPCEVLPAAAWAASWDTRRPRPGRHELHVRRPARDRGRFSILAVVGSSARRRPA